MANKIDLENLLAQMTLDEKIGQLVQTNGIFFIKDDSELTGPAAELGISLDYRKNIGSLLNFKNAENAKLQLISQMEQELIVEGLIKAKGFEDCVISITDSNVNAVVKAEELSSTEVAQIVAVIQSQLNTGIENIKIIPVE